MCLDVIIFSKFHHIALRLELYNNDLWNKVKWQKLCTKGKEIWLFDVFVFQ